jgi:RNA polymerase sigma factor (sigma-70 family)
VAKAELTQTLQHLRQVAAQRCDGGLSDAALLERFAASRDEAAFEVLVWRHGPLVLGVCRRALGNQHDAEDAVQATFLALARQAASIARRASLAAWLSRVAYRAALRARRRVRKHGREPLPPEDLPAPPLPDHVAFQEIRLALDEELQRLPEKYRVPLVLSYLQGLTNKEVARQVGCPIGTVFTRLARGRELLLSRLTRRGLTLSAAALAVLLEGSAAAAALPASFVKTTTLAAAAFAAGQGTSAVLSPGAIGLAEEVLHVGAVNKFRTITAVGLLLAVATAGLFAIGVQPAEQAKTQPGAAAAPPARLDRFGDPLPDGAVARLGSARLRHAELASYVCLPGGKVVLTAGTDGVLRFWDLATGRQVRVRPLEGKNGPGEVLTLSPDGKTLAAVHQGKLVFWEVESGKEVKVLPAPKSRAVYLRFSPDGKILAVARNDWHVSFWDWQAEKERQVKLSVFPARGVQISMNSTFHGSFSPDGKWFVAGAHQLQPLGVFDVASGREVRRFTAHALTSTFSPDSKRLAVCSTEPDKRGRQTVIRLLELATGKEIKRFPLGTERWYFSLAFSPDGKALACGFSDDGFVMDCSTGRVLYHLKESPARLSFSRDGKTLLASSGQRVRLWDAATGKERHDFPGEFQSSLATALSPDGRLLAAAAWHDREVSLWDPRSGRLVHRLPLKGEGMYVRSLSFVAGGKTLVAAHFQGLLQFWDVATGKEQRTAQLADLDPPNRRQGYFYHLHVSSDGKHVSTLERVLTRPGWSTRLGYRETATGKLLQHLPLPGEVRQAAWRADGKDVILPLPDGLTRVEVDSGRVRFRVAAATGPLIAATLDHRLFAAPLRATPDTVGVWETITGQEVTTLAVGQVAHLALAADDRSLVTTDEKFLRVWDLATGKERRRWALPVAMTNTWGETFVRQLRLFPDGRRAFTALADGTALIWDLSPALRGAAPLVKAPGQKELSAWWADLQGADAGRAYAAVWRLAEVPEQTVPFLRQQLRPASLNAELVRKHIADLDSDSFAVREKAYKSLEKLGSAVVPALRQALENKPSLEVRTRLQRLLERADRLPLSSEVLRQLRALQVLERIASKEARQLLAELARGAAHAPQTQQARAALERLSLRPVRP